MKIRYLSNSKEDHVENQLGRSLINAGLAEACADPTAPGCGPKPDVTPRWSVVVTGGTQSPKYVCIQLQVAGSIQQYIGHPKHVNARKEWQGGGRWLNFGREVPEAIVKEYKKLWNDHEELRAPLGAGYDVRPETDEQRYQRRELEEKNRAAANLAMSDAEVEGELKRFNAQQA
jgi:hypothetical protein